MRPRRATTRTRAIVLRTARAHPHLNTSQIAHLAGCSPSTASRHLTHRKQPPTVSGRLMVQARSADRHQRELAAVHAASDPRLLGRLAVDPVGDVRSTVASHPACAQHLVRRLASDPYQWVRQAAAARSDCPKRVMRLLAGDSAVGVRIATASNPACPPELLDVLAADPDDTVRSCVATNPNCPKSTLRRLARDRRREVYVAAAKRLPLTNDAFNDYCATAPTEQRRVLLARDDCPPELLARVARGGHGAVSQAAASNPAIPSAVLDELVDSPEESIRAAAAANPACGAARLERLAKDRSPAIRALVAANPHCPKQVLKDLTAKTEETRVVVAAAANPRLPTQRLRYLALHPPAPEVSAAAATNPNCPPGLLRRFGSSLSWLTRYNAVSNPNCPEQILEERLADPDVDVAERARQMLRSRRFASIAAGYGDEIEVGGPP